MGKCRSYKALGLFSRAVLCSVVSASAGCEGLCYKDLGESYAERPGQDRAVSYVWRAEFREGAGPPAVGWVDDPIVSGKVDGVYCGCRVVVTWRGSHAGSVLAHELLHAHLDSALGDPDGDHAGPDWKRLDGINDRLREMGL